MAEYHTEKGATLTIADNKLTAVVNGSKYQSEPRTATSESTWTRIGKIWLSNGTRSVAVIYTPDLAAWCRDNWPITKTTLEQWEDMAPQQAQDYRKWQYDLIAERDARANGNWNISAGPEPKLDTITAAYIQLDNMQLSEDCNKSSIGLKYISSVLSGMDITAAAAAAKKEYDDTLDIWR